MTCQQELRTAGKPYPRTCADCGLGPCRNGPNASAGGGTVTPLKVAETPAKADLLALVEELRVGIEDGSDTVASSAEPPLLRVPQHFRSVSDVLAVAGKMDLPNALVLSELPNGALVFLDSGLNMAEANWLLDRMKALLLAPDQPMRPTP